MRRYFSNRRVAAGAAIGLALAACNEILDNDPRSWDPNAGEEAGAPASGGGGEPGKGGAGGNAGASGKGGANGKGGASGRGGSASSGRGGAATGEAGTSGGLSSGGEAAAVAGTGGEDDTSGAGGTPVACECTPGTREDNVEPCGDCMTGMRTQTKTCLDDCTWGQFGEFGECMGVTATCSPGTPGSQTVPCPCGGTKGQARSCTDACEWSGWSDTSGCDLECCSEIVYCNTPDNISPASRGTWCRETQSACTNEEVNADCHADIPVVCGALVPELYIEYR